MGVVFKYVSSTQGAPGVAGGWDSEELLLSSGSSVALLEVPDLQRVIKLNIERR